MKRTIPLLITAVIGTLLIASYFIPAGPFAEIERQIPNFFNIIASFAWQQSFTVVVSRLSQGRTSPLASMISRPL